MAKCINGVALSGELSVTPYTVCSDVVRTCCFTSRSNFFFLLFLACLTSYYSAFNVSTNGTGRRSLTSSVAHGMAKLGNGIGVTGKLVATSSAVYYLVIRTCCCASRSNFLILNGSSLGVTENGNSSSLGGSTADGTFLMLCALFVTGSCLILNPVGLGMTKRSDRLGVENCGTNSTFLMLATCGSTSRLKVYDPTTVGVTESGNDLLCKSGLTANSTYSTVGQTVFFTGCRIAGYGLVSVTECGAIGFLTQSTGLGSQASSFCPNVFEGFALFQITSCTVLCAVAGCGDPDVAECLTACYTAKGTSCGSLTIRLNPLVVESRALRLITEGTYLGGTTGCFRPSMGELFTFSSSAGTSFRCLTGSLHPVVHMFRFRLFTKEGRKLVT